MFARPPLLLATSPDLGRRTSPRARVARVILCLSVTALAPSLSAQTLPDQTEAVAGLCGSLDNGYGPYDYRTASPAQRKIVEQYHFTTNVELLRSGVSSTIGADLDYTLRAFPNHARALYALSRYATRLNATRLPGAHYPVECYFERAVRFAPDDGQARALYADYLIKRRRTDEARDQLLSIEKIPPQQPQVLYNMGLAWFELKDYEKSLAYAKQAYAAGIQFPGLRDKLKRAGHWRDSP